MIVDNLHELCSSLNQIFHLTSFSQLGLSAPILKALASLGFQQPTDIQAKAIPTLLTTPTDLLGLAQTGTGKTAAYGLPLLDLLDPFESYTQALILAPTRELCQQIAEQLTVFSSQMPQIRIAAVYGGAPIFPQIKALKEMPHIIIATPGRLLDVIQRKAARLNRLRWLVLDEADEMLNMGFKEDLDSILSSTPDTKNTWLFSATMAPEIQRIVKQYMEKPVEVRVNRQQEVNVNITHQYAIVHATDKTEALTRFLDLYPNMRGIVFTRTKRDAQQLSEDLLKRHYRADSLHGDLSQPQRDRVMKRFKAHDLQVLIATDVAARGIDVQDLTHVFHFSLPDDLAYYTHRSGRTARAGKTGSSIAFISQHNKHVIDKLEKQLGIRFEQVLIPSAQDIAAQRMEGWCMQVLQTGAKGALSKDILDRAQVLFGGLSKEELLAKVLHYELRSLEIHTTRDLNAVEQKKWKKVMGQKKPVSQLKPGKKKWDSSRPRDSRKSFRQK